MKKRKLIIIISILLAVSLFILHQLKSENIPEAESDQESSVNMMNPQLKQMWMQNKAINPDYVGNIVFDSSLIDLPFVQAKGIIDSNGNPYRFYDIDGNIINDTLSCNGNDVYIWMNWKDGTYDRYDEGGSIFMDYRNTTDDINLIIYGHHFSHDYDPEGKKQFTPLDLLIDEENYKDNCYLSLILDNEIRRYVICNVCLLDATDEKDLQIARTDPKYDLSGNADPDYLSNYYDRIKMLSYYETDEELAADDFILTLITCIEHQPKYRQAVICKQIESIKYEG